MTTQMDVDFSRPYPVFPLNQCLLLPDTVLPLHVFESRYRQMVKDALDSHGLIAMAFFRRDVSEQQYLHGRPELRRCAGLGRIAQYEAAGGGRYFVVMEGVCRVLLEEEVYNEPYRLFRMTPFDVHPPDETVLSGERLRIEEKLKEQLNAFGSGQSELENLLEKTPSTRALVDRLIVAVCGDPEQKYRLLAEPDPVRRAKWLIRNLHKLTSPDGGPSRN